jgi:hypothetical protein
MSAGTFPGCGGSEELISVILGMVPRRLSGLLGTVLIGGRGRDTIGRALISST